MDSGGLHWGEHLDGMYWGPRRKYPFFNDVQGLCVWIEFMEEQTLDFVSVC